MNAANLDTKFHFDCDGTILEQYADNIIGISVSGAKDAEKIEYRLSDELIGEIEYSDNTQVSVICLKEGKTILTAKLSNGETAELEVVVIEEDAEISSKID